MTKPNTMALGFFVVAGLFLGVAIYGAVRDRLNAAFLAVAVVFFVLGLATSRKGTRPPGAGSA
jgi:hypothetical protein